jgi:leucyl aminopeptidase
MTDFAALLQPHRGQSASTIHLVDKASFPEWVKGRPAADRALLEAHRFDGKTGYAYALLPRGESVEVVSAVTNVADLSPWCLAKLGEALPAGSYRLADDGQPGPAALGWLLAQHRFDAYKSKPDEPRGARVLLSGEPARVGEWIQQAEATALVRDLVDTPAADLGPAELEAAIRDWAKGCGAEVTVTTDDALEREFPMVAAVGGAAIASRAPA